MFFRALLRLLLSKRPKEALSHSTTVMLNLFYLVRRLDVYVHTHKLFTVCECSCSSANCSFPKETDTQTSFGSSLWHVPTSRPGSGIVWDNIAWHQPKLTGRGHIDGWRSQMLRVLCWGPWIHSVSLASKEDAHKELLRCAPERHISTQVTADLSDTFILVDEKHLSGSRGHEIR